VEKMASYLGIIKTIIGNVVAIAPNGYKRTLEAGDRVFSDEIINTDSTAAVSIEFLDGSTMDIGRNDQAILDNETLSLQNSTLSPGMIESEVESIQQALLDGADPTKITAATAAGEQPATNQNEGTDAVQILHNQPTVTPTSGFDTTPPELSFPVINDDDHHFENKIGDGSLADISNENAAPPIANAVSLQMSVANEKASNHIINGSFEDLNVTRSWGHYDSNRINGWDSNSHIEIWDHVGRYKASDGKQHMELDYARAIDAVSQTMNMSEGKYTLTFDAANRGTMTASNPSNDFNVLWNNQVVASIKGSEISAGASGKWDSFTFEVNATTGNNTLTFIETAQGNNSLGPLLDNIKLIDYSYDLTINATLTDHTESLSSVLIPVSSLNGSTIEEVTGVVSLEGNNYKVTVSDGIDTTVKLLSTTELSDTDINAIKGSVTSSEMSGTTVIDSTTTTTTALNEIDGGVGNDILTGSTGDDLFVWQTSDAGTVSTPAQDQITNFEGNTADSNANPQDVLDLSDLLSNPSNNYGIEGLDNGGHLQLNIGVIDNSGHVAAPVQTIDLNNVTVNLGDNVDDMLATLLNNGAINDGI